jgi:hypothetical protein
MISKLGCDVRGGLGPRGGRYTVAYEDDPFHLPPNVHAQPRAPTDAGRGEELMRASACGVLLDGNGYGLDT